MSIVVTLNLDETFSASNTLSDQTYDVQGTARLTNPAGAWTFPAAWDVGFRRENTNGCNAPAITCAPPAEDLLLLEGPFEPVQDEANWTTTLPAVDMLTVLDPAIRYGPSCTLTATCRLQAPLAAGWSNRTLTAPNVGPFCPLLVPTAVFGDVGSAQEEGYCFLIEWIPDSGHTCPELIGDWCTSPPSALTIPSMQLSLEVTTEEYEVISLPFTVDWFTFEAEEEPCTP